MITGYIRMRTKGGINLVVSSHYLYPSGDISSLAHGHIEDGLFQGVVHYGNESYHIEPSAKYLTHPDTHSLIYKESDVLIQPA